MGANPGMAVNQGGFNPAMGVDPAMQQLPSELPTALPARQSLQYQQQYQYPQQQQQQYQNEPVPSGNAAGNTGIRSLAEESASTGLEGDTGLAAAFAAAQADVEREERQPAPIQAPAVAPLGNASGQARSIPSAGGSNEVLPTIQELAASGRSFPDMRLDIHSFADKPTDRFIFVNMRKYGEGSTLQEGPAVERITEEGVVLNQQGLRFLLPRP
jgi:general secretion pathway protein B